MARDPPRDHARAWPARLATGRPIAGYIGFDPSAASLHVGHLVPIFGLLRLQRFGGRPVALVGGGTGMIGDPSGPLGGAQPARPRDARGERRRRSAASSSGSSTSRRARRGAVMVNNLDWLGELSLIDFLRDTGKHFTVPYMLAKDSVQVAARARPVVHRVQLHAPPGVRLRPPAPDDGRRAADGRRRPVGQHHGRPRAHPADGRGRRGRHEQPAHGLAYKLLLSPSGTKFGKSEAGDSVWLDPARTSPYAFYQYWLNTDDRDVGTYLRWFTEFAARARSRRSRPSSRARPEARAAQRALALDITARTHGDGRRGSGRSPTPRRCSRARPIADPAVLRVALRVGRRVHVRRRRALARASRSLLADAGRLRVEAARRAG